MTPEAAMTESLLLAAQDERFQERIFHALNAVWSSFDDDVIPCLAYLAAEYQAAGRPADVRYKCIARFLQDSTKRELEALRMMVARVATKLESGAARVDVIARKRSNQLLIRGQGDEALDELPIPCRGDNLLRRMSDTYLGDEERLFNASDCVSFNREQLEQFRRYVAPPIV